MAKIPVSFSGINLPPPTSYVANNALTTNDPLSQYKRVGGGFNARKKKIEQKNNDFVAPNLSTKQFTAESVHSVPTNPQFRKLLAKNKQEQRDVHSL